MTTPPNTEIGCNYFLDANSAFQVKKMVAALVSASRLIPTLNPPSFPAH